MKGKRILMRILILTLFGVALGQTVSPRGLPLKAQPTDYEFQGHAGKLTFGVNYMGRSFSASRNDPNAAVKTTLHDAGEYIVLELAAFAPKKFEGDLRAADFRLLVNGSRISLSPAAPGLVAHTLRNREMDPQRRHLELGGGMGNAGVTLGQPRPQARFPGDPRPGQQRPPGTVTLSEEQTRDWDAAIESALPEGPITSGRAGNLYFEYKGKMTKVKSLILQYEGSGGKMELRLR